MSSQILVGYTLPDSAPVPQVDDTQSVSNAHSSGAISSFAPTDASVDSPTPQHDADNLRRADALSVRNPSHKLYSQGLRFKPGTVEPLHYEDQLHLTTIAPTGAGKGRSLLIPNMIHWNDQAIIVDVKGEISSVTAGRRRELGQQTHIIAPFGTANQRPGQTASLNPFDTFDISSDDDEVNDAANLAYLICSSAGGAGDINSSSLSSNNAFWEHNARGLLTGIILAIMSVKPRRERNFATLYKLLHGSDVVYELAVMLDTYPRKGNPAGKPSRKAKSSDDKAEEGGAEKKKAVPYLHDVAYAEIGAFLQMPDLTRGGVLSTAQSYLKLYASSGVQQSLSNTSFPVKDFISGKPMTIYLVLPPDKLRSHSVLMKLWVSTLLKIAFSRTQMPPQSTLFLVDEAAQLGHLDELEKAITLGRGYGLQMWTFWQDLNQMMDLYPTSWQTMINNSAVVNCFDPRNHMMRRQYAQLMGVKPSVFDLLQRDEQLVMLGGKVYRAWLPDYLKDPAFDGLYAPNPYYEGRSA